MLLDVLKIDITNELRDKRTIWCCMVFRNGSHVPDEKAMTNQLLQALKPGGQFINIRKKELNENEKLNGTDVLLLPVSISCVVVLFVFTVFIRFFIVFHVYIVF